MSAIPGHAWLRSQLEQRKRQGFFCGFLALNSRKSTRRAAHFYECWPWACLAAESIGTKKAASFFLRLSGIA
ncbi:MAG: hypothetical protein CVU39_06260 [Chloroflexi bacterium HGW-Chloroflexi-10]|nr:MAG: hypothetical protein CVU39_06260 [Chloroflexi bacterium HGW-Chloroflexi-10]